jgi:hypothetical protein
LEPAKKEIMNGQQKPPVLLIMCAVIVVLSVLGIVGGLSTRLIGSLDGLLMLAICLMMALIFVLLLFVLAKEQGWIGKRGPDGGATPPPAAGK